MTKKQKSPELEIELVSVEDPEAMEYIHKKILECLLKDDESTDSGKVNNDGQCHRTRNTGKTLWPVGL